MNWTKAPSVTPGGKPYFWTGVHKDIRYWVSWDRVRKMWTVTRELKSGGYSKGLAWFKTPEAGKRFVENI